MRKKNQVFFFFLEGDTVDVKGADRKKFWWRDGECKKGFETRRDREKIKRKEERGRQKWKERQINTKL